MQANRQLTIGLLSLSSVAVLVGAALAMRQAPLEQVTAIPARPLTNTSDVNQLPTVTNQQSPAASPQPPTLPQTPPAQTGEQVAATTSVARRPITLTDQVKPGSSFDRFRQQLRQAVRDRDAAFLRQIADPQIQLSFGRTMTLDQLEIDNSNAVVWQHLERVLTIGCAPYEAPANAPTHEAWTCPHVAQASVGDPFTDVYIVGTDINVRSRPEANSSVVAVLSNEVVPYDSVGAEQLSQLQKRNMETVDGWKPVITPEGIRGYVSSRYAYTPAGYRARFEQKQGAWKMILFIAGD